MNVISKFFAQLPAHWQERVKKEDWFSLPQFDGNVVVNFEDGTFLYFNCAFYVHDKKRRELAVFTEHCGYYILPTAGASWRRGAYA